MDKVQKPSNSECYTPSSEPIRIYKPQDVEGYKMTKNAFGSCALWSRINGRRVKVNEVSERVGEAELRNSLSDVRPLT
jgi:hypothetical protein